MNSLRETLIQEKAKEIQRQVTEWASKRDIVGIDEEIVITMEIRRRPIVTVSVIDYGYKANKARFLAVRVSDEEWKNIESFFGERSEYMEILRLVRHHSLKNKDIGNKMAAKYQTHQVYTRICNINKIFRTTESLSKFRIRSLNGLKGLYRVE